MRLSTTALFLVRKLAVFVLGNPRLVRVNDGFPSFLIFLLVYLVGHVAILLGGVEGPGQATLFRWMLALTACGLGGSLPLPWRWVERTRRIVRPLTMAALFTFSFVVVVPAPGQVSVLGVTITTVVTAGAAGGGGGGGGWGCTFYDKTLNLGGC